MCFAAVCEALEVTVDAQPRNFSGGPMYIRCVEAARQLQNVLPSRGVFWGFWDLVSLLHEQFSFRQPRPSAQAN